MADTINETAVEIEQSDDKISFLENKIGIADDRVVDEMNKLDLNKISNKERINRIMNGLNKTLNNQKILKFRNSKTITIK